jgi:hypothetical protein
MRKNPFIATLQIIIFVLIARPSLLAEHIAGAELNYRSLGNNQYEVDYLVYTDYPTSAPGTQAILEYSSASCSATGSTVLLLQENRCVTYKSSCRNASSSFTPTIRKWVFSATVHFTTSCEDWKLRVNGCCRMAFITTLEDPELSVIRTEATLNNLDGQFSSPVFVNPPVFYVLTGQSNRINAAVTADDADSVSTSIIPARTTAQKEVQYLTEGGFLQPFRSGPVLSPLVSRSEFVVKPSDPETGILDMEIQAWKNGRMTGAIAREHRIMALESSNHLPSLTGIDGTGTYDVNTCAGKKTAFYLFTSDEDRNDKVTVTMLDTLPGATCVPSGDQTPAYRFEWNTPATEITDRDYLVRLLVSDNSCPMPGVQQYALRIHVTGLGITAVTTPVTCIGRNDGSAHVTVDESMGPFTYLWKETGITTALAEGLTEGTHTLFLNTHSGCRAEYAVNVKGRPAFAPTSLSVIDAGCSNSASGAIFLMLPKEEDRYEVSWTPSGKNSLNITNILPGTHTVTVREKETGCSMAKSFDVGYSFTAPKVDLGPDQSICMGTPVFLEPGKGFRYHTWQDGSDSAAYHVKEAGEYSVQVTDDYGCTGTGRVRVDFIACQSPKNPLGEEGISIYPNPAKNILNISFKEATSGDTRLYVTDLLGKQLMDRSVPSETTSTSILIDAYPDGVYLLYVEQGSNAAVYRFVKE